MPNKLRLRTLRNQEISGKCKNLHRIFAYCLVLLLKCKFCQYYKHGHTILRIFGTLPNFSVHHKWNEMWLLVINKYGLYACYFTWKLELVSDNFRPVTAGSRNALADCGWLRAAIVDLGWLQTSFGGWFWMDVDVFGCLQIVLGDLQF